MTTPDQMTDEATSDFTAPPPHRLIDRLIRAFLGATVAAGVAWGLWRLLAGGAVASAVGLLAGIATIAVWLIFETPDDPGGGWLGLVAIPGPVRVLGELALLGLAATVIWLGGSRAASETLLTVAGLHLFLSWERAVWLLGRRATVDQGKD